MPEYREGVMNRNVFQQWLLIDCIEIITIIIFSACDYLKTMHIHIL